MKLTAIILLTASLQLCARGVSQTLTISLKNASLEKVFSEIQKQAGYSFFYEDGLLKNARHVDVSVVKASIVQVLDLCFVNQPFTYKIVNNAVSVRRKEQVVQSSFMSKSSLAGDPVTVSGKVTDEKGQPLSGANVKVKGSNIGTTTDNLGRFTLSNLNEDAILEISFVGHDPQTFHIKGKAFIAIALGQKSAEMDEAVVIAYGTTSRRFTTGNISTVKADDIEKAPVQNPLMAIQGRVPGVEITQLTGMNGGGVSVRIQGQNSAANNNNPLIVVDGIPYPTQLIGSTNTTVESVVQGGSPLSYINPNDIESITILKDADATSIYGSRAANGAILITTKKGKADRYRLSINLQQGWGNVGHFVKMLDTRQYLDMRYEALRNDGIAISTLTPNYSNYDLTTWDTTRYTNWQKTLLGNAAQYSNFQAGFSGGTNTLNYLIGATYNRQSVVFPGQFDDKVGNVHFNINSTSPNQRFKMQVTGSYSYDQNHLPGRDLTSQALLTEPVAPALFNGNGTLNWAPDINGSSTWSNPLAFTLNTDFINNTKNLLSNINLSYRILPGLEFRSSFGYSNLQNDIFMPFRLNAYAPEDRPYVTRSSSFGNRNMSSWIIDPQIQYAGKIAKGTIEGLLATSIQKSSYTNLQILGSGFLTDLLMKTLRAATSTSILQSLSGITRFNALFGRLGYKWKDKYLINISARRDGSNKFGAQNRFHNFGSVGLGWIFSDEKWLKNLLPVLSFGKLRASYGTTGNDGIPDFSYLSIYSINNPTILYQNSIGLVAANIPNPYLQWEDTHKWNGGVDVGLLRDRILFGVNYSVNKSSNQLLSLSIPTVTGFQTISKNLPDFVVRNTNWEFTLNSINIKSKKVSWNSSLNLTIPRNKLESVPDLPYFSNIGLGQPLGSIQVTRYAGINPANGSYLVMDVNNNPITSIPTIADRNMYVSTLSRYYGGVLNSIQYMGFQIDFLFQFVKKKGPRDMYYYNGLQSPGFFSSGQSNQPVSVLDRWKKPGDNALAGQFNTKGLNNVITYSDMWYSYEASYVRLKNVSLSWLLPTSWLKKMKLQNGRLYAHGQNLATITRYRGLDPETMSLSILPPLRMITIGGQIEF